VGEPSVDGAPNDTEDGLPAAVSSFIGRVAEVSEVRQLVRDHRLVTLTGAGGSGKTRLALQVATETIEDQFDDIWWVDLSLVRDAPDVVEHVARTLDAGAARLDGVFARLTGDRASLIVLDNVEHVVEPTVDLVGRVLSTCPNVRVLATSRQLLGADGEVVWRVPPLSMPCPGVPLTFESLSDFDAVSLFLERVRAGRRGLVVDRDVLRHVDAICVAVEGMPLALELAAAQVRTSPISDVARRIAEVTSWSSAPRGSSSERHRSLRASIAWSIDLLRESDRRVLRRLAVFRSPFTREAAAAVAASNVDRDDLTASLGRLVDTSLLQLDDGSERYRMLETVKQFCAEAGATDDDHDALRAIHARYYAAWCTEVGDGLRGIEEQRIALEMPDVVEALGWARCHEPALALQMCVGLASVWTALARTTATAATWNWLMSFDGARRDGDWGAAVAALMSWATSQHTPFDGLADEVSRALPADASRARGWMARGAAMVPAYRGQMGPIVEYTEAVAARGDDLELSVYGGFAAYMLALVGRIDESEHWLHQLRRLTRRHHTSFAVETIGNGYAAAILVDALRGDLRSATQRSDCGSPTSSLFALTAAAALAQAALWRADCDTMHRAVEWVDRPIVPLLAYTAPLVRCTASLLDGDMERAADLAEDFIELAPRVPVGFAQGWPMCQRALLSAGRAAIARQATQSIAANIEWSDPAPYSRAALHLAMAQDAATHDDIHAVEQHARDLLDVAARCGFELHVVDALELIAWVAARSGHDSTAGAILSATDAHRHEVEYRHRVVELPWIEWPADRVRLSLHEAIDLARAPVA
jgi:predicted ATPase